MRAAILLVILGIAAIAAAQCPASVETNKFVCVLDGVHNDQYLWCYNNGQGGVGQVWMNCPGSETCAFAGVNDYNPCRLKQPTPCTPGEHSYWCGLNGGSSTQYYECAINGEGIGFQGFRPCAPGTTCSVAGKHTLTPPCN